MLIEIILFSPLLVLWYYSFIELKTFLIFFSIYYWLPKWLFLNLFLEKYYPQIITRNPNVTNKIALTFDDAPYGYHQEIIKLLDKFNMKGTFFVISDSINDRNKQVLIDAIKNGHQLGNHGKTNSMHALKTQKSLENEIDICDMKIKEIYDEAQIKVPTMMVYRPGCGLFNKKMLNMINSKNYTLALGSVYPNDPMFRSSLINYFYLIKHIENGDVVILHDRKWTIPLLEMLLPWLQKKSLVSVTLEKLI